jgi:hypothetical protein
VIDRGIKIKVIRERGELSIPWKVRGAVKKTSRKALKSFYGE